MRRFNFIPPRSLPRLPAARPATVAAEIGTGGTSYKVLVDGVPIQMFTGGSSDLAVGDLVMARVVPNSHLFLPSPPAAEELWLSPGAQWPVTTHPGELWKYTGSGLPTYVLSAPNNNEHWTHLALSQIDSELYGFSYHSAGNGTMRAYRINRALGSPTLVTTRSVAYTDPVVDSAEKGNYLYLILNTYNSSPSEIIRFDPVAGTFTQVFSFTAAGSVGFGGGIAVDAVSGDLVAWDGVDVYRSPSGDVGSWVFEIDLYAAMNMNYDGFCLFTNRYDDNYVYAGLNSPTTPATDPLVGKRTGAASWVGELVDAAHGGLNGVVAFTQEYSGTTPARLWAQYGGFASLSNPPSVYYKDAGGGAWTKDWDGPPADGRWNGLYSQGLAWFKSKVYGLYLDQTTPLARLYRRDSAGSWSIVKDWSSYYTFVGLHYTTGMAVAPNANRKCHEV